MNSSCMKLVNDGTQSLKNNTCYYLHTSMMRDVKSRELAQVLKDVERHLSSTFHALYLDS